MKKRQAAGLFATVALCGFVSTQPAFSELHADTHQPARSFTGAFLAADIARQDNNFGAAARYFEEALAYDPDNTLIEGGLLISLLTDGQFNDAVPVAQRLSQIKGVNVGPTAQLVLGVDALRAERYSEAFDALDMSSQSDLERLMGGIMRAWTLQARDQTQQALELIDALRGPEWYALFGTYHAGLIALMAGDRERAITLLDSALDNQAGGGASPLTYLRAAQARARLALAEGNRAEAIDAIDKGLTLAPTNPPLVTLRETLDTPSARQPLIATTQQGAAEILLNLGSAINNDGSESFAALYIELARALAPESDNVLYELGAIAERLNQPERAISYYDLVPETSPLQRIAALQQGLNLADMDRKDEAIETLQALVDANPADYRGYLALGGVHASEENWAETARVYETALEHIDNNEPTYWPLHYRLAIAYERMKFWEKAEPRFLKTLELSPDRPDVLNYLGYSWIDMNINLAEGLEMIRKAVELRPRSGYIVDSLGWAYYRLGKFEDAVTQLERAADLEPRDPTINDHLGDAYWRVGRKLEATYQWATSLDFDPDEDLKAKIATKLEAARTAGVVPAVAVSVVDEQSSETQASDVSTGTTDGG